jgi:predicted Rossmann fold flavoprotein
MKRDLLQNKIWDVIVVGAGPAGMMAAGRAAEMGRSVLLLEKNPTLGKKLLITGGGRCNVTNNKTNIRILAEKYKKDSKFLFSAFSQFAVTETLEFFHTRGMPTKEENEGRMFPVSDKAQSVFDVLIEYMQEYGVDIKTQAAVTSLVQDENTKIFTLKTKDKSEFQSKSCIVATGGISHPETGSTGEGFNWLKKMGHTIIDNNFALVPIAIKDAWVKKLSGVTLQNIKITAYQKEKKQAVAKGKLLFTHVGISGPTVLNMSKEIGDILPYGPVTLFLDLFPQLDHAALRAELQNHLIEESNKLIKNTLAHVIASSLVAPLLEMAEIAGDTPNHSVSRDQRLTLVKLLKAIPLNVKGLLGANKAIVSSGGVDLKEVNFKTMESRLVPGLYFVGDVLNIDRPSGGYSLQLCWTTGYVSGSSCAERE